MYDLVSLKTTDDQIRDCFAKISYLEAKQAKALADYYSCKDQINKARREIERLQIEKAKGFDPWEARK